MKEVITISVATDGQRTHWKVRVEDWEIFRKKLGQFIESESEVIEERK